MKNAEATVSPAPQSVRLPGTRQWDLRWQDQTHRVWIAEPLGPVPAGGYPVLYTLDGNSSFPLAYQMVRNLATRPDAAQLGGVIVVGLGYATDDVLDMAARARDYTFEKPSRQPADDTQVYGGGDGFLDYVATQVQPRIAEQFNVDMRRQTLFGHSYGGLLTLHTLFTRGNMFSRYFAASPSIWWNHRAILRERDHFMARQTQPMDQQLWLTAGSLEEPSVAEAPDERGDKQRARRQVSSGRELVAGMRTLMPGRTRFDVLPNADHGGVLVPSLVHAVNMALQPVGPAPVWGRA